MITTTERIISQGHREAYKLIYAELSKPWREIALAVRESGSSDVYSAFELGVMEKAQWNAVRFSGHEVTKQLPQKSGANLLQWQQDVQWAMRGHNLKYVRGIDEWQRKAMLKVLEGAVEKQQTPVQIANEFLKNGLQISAVRAERIAVTEGTRGAAMGVMLAANSFPYECMKAWVASGDNRVRRSPFNHNIQVEDMRELYDSWNNGEAIMFPGDPRASASNVVHCRCMLALVAKRDVDGNLIPKRVVATNRQLLTGIMAGVAGAALAFLLEEIFSDD